jgi:hypothetical protein
LEHLQIAKSRGKGAPKKKRTAAGKRARGTSVYKLESARLTAPTQRARWCSARCLLLCEGGKPAVRCSHRRPVRLAPPVTGGARLNPNG